MWSRRSIPAAGHPSSSPLVAARKIAGSQQPALLKPRKSLCVLGDHQGASALPSPRRPDQVRVRATGHPPVAILMYTAWSYWVFRGKVRADIGHD